MPKEFELLRRAPYAKEYCKNCGQVNPEFMRGLVQSTWRRLLKMKYCAVICHNCKQIIGWEKPDETDSVNEDDSDQKLSGL